MAYWYDAHGNLLTIRGTKDRNASYTYDSRNLMTSQTDAMGVKTTYAYDANGQLIRETVPGLGTTEYTYHKGMISSVKDPNGNVSKLAYDGMGNLIRSTDSQGNTTENTYDAIGHLLTSKDAMGNVTSYTYDYVGNLTSVTDALGNKTAFTYDKAGRLTKETYPDGTSVKYTYDVMGNCIKKSFADGTSESYTYDSVGNMIGTVLSDGSKVSCKYDSLGHKISETDAGGNTVKYAYYPNGNLQKTTYPDGSTEIYSYDQAWKLMEVKDRSGAATYYEYDAGGNMTLQRDALGNTWKYGYDQHGRLTSETDANGNTTTYSYDSNGNCIQKTDAAGVSAYMEYDSLNRMTKAYTKTSDGEVYSISYTYDALGRVTSSTDEMGYITRMAYDAVGNLISTTDAAGIVTMTATYDSMGRTGTVKDALGVTTAYSYDTMGNLLQAVEALNAENSRKTTYTYNALGRTTSVTDPLQGVTQAAYDSQGNVSSITDANGGVTQYQYDRMGQLTAEISPLGSKTSYTYNAAGLLTESRNARNQDTTYTYDKAGRITSMTDELGTTEYTYDANGNLLTVTDAQGTITREYDALNRVTRYTDARGNTVRYGYDEIGNLIYLTYPGGEIVRCSYYKNGWLETVTDPAGNVTRYSYDARGNLTCTERPNGTKETCTYSDAGLLLTQNDTRGGEVLTAYSYTYDESGNITAISGTGTTDTKEGISALSGATMTYDAENRLLTYNGEELHYDADGNMTYGPVNGVMSELVYDCRNRLVSAGGVAYTYDAENNRIAMESDRHRETYVVDTASGSMSRVLTITDGSGTTTLCIYGQGLICEKTGDIYQYHHYNNLGSTMKLTDAKGGETASFTYGTYGELLSGSTGFTRFLYNGRCGVTTDDNGFYYMRQRYYSPELKRFVNQDVIRGSLDNSQSLNRYSYVQGNPVSYTDPFGLSPQNGLFTGASFWHGVFGLLGCIPGPIGALANFIDCGIYLAQGDYFGAALCFMNGVTMGATTVASTLLKAGKLCSVANTALRVAMVSERIAGGLTFAQNAYNIGQTGIQMYCKYGIMGESLGLDTVGEVLGIGLSAMGCLGGLSSMGSTSKELLALQKKVDAGMLCFVAGTKVKTLDGDKNIEDIEVGDEVWSCDVETGETGGKRVTRLSVNEFSDIAHVTIDGETIDATTTHPFYVEGYGFKPAGQLLAGEKVRLLDGGTEEVEDVTVEHLEEPVKVYNFEVEDWHTYYVAKLGVLVHNEGCSTGNGGKLVNIELKYKDGWTDAQKAAADAKVKALSEAITVKTSVNRGKTSASSTYKSVYGKSSVLSGYDVDHIIDLQLGGADDILNMNPLDRSVNRSLGVQIKNAIKNYPVGTQFGQFTIS